MYAAPSQRFHAPPDSEDPATALTARLLGEARRRQRRLRRVAVGARPDRSADEASPEPARARSGPRVGLLVGSASDLEALRPTEEVLRAFGVGFAVHGVNVRLAGEALRELTARAESATLEALIAASGADPLFPGIVAAATPLPVLAVPVPVPGACDARVGDVSLAKSIVSAGAVNAALCAVRLLALRDPVLRERIDRFERLGAARPRRQPAIRARANGFAA